MSSWHILKIIGWSRGLIYQVSNKCAYTQMLKAFTLFSSKNQCSALIYYCRGYFSYCVIIWGIVKVNSFIYSKDNSILTFVYWEIFYMFWPIFGNFWCPVITLVTFSSNLSNFEGNPKKPKKSKKNPKNFKKFQKIQKSKKVQKIQKIQKKSKKNPKNFKQFLKIPHTGDTNSLDRCG